MIIYLHGFNSTGNSLKGKTVQSALADKISVYTPTYHYQPVRAITDLSSFIEEILSQHPNNETRMIIGSSLGGFYAQYLARQFTGFKVVLINPALGPIDTLKEHLGENENYYTGEKYILTQKHLDDLNQYNIETPCSSEVPTLILIDKEDEIIDYRFALDKYQSCAEIKLFAGGDHQFQHLNESIPTIEHFYNR